jgi:hypothetical protein
MQGLHRHGALIALALVGGLVATAAACSKKQQTPSEPFGWAKDEPTTAPLAPTSPPPPAKSCEGCSTRGVTVLPQTPDPEALRLFLESLAGPGGTFAKASDPPKLTEAALRNTALGAAFAMKPAGEMHAATLREGERASLPVTLEASECATFVAQGGLGTVEVDMFLIQPGSPAPGVIKMDTEPGQMAAIGRGDCVRGPLSAELHVRMRRGEGVVLIQRFLR